MLKYLVRRKPPETSDSVRTEMNKEDEGLHIGVESKEMSVEEVVAGYADCVNENGENSEDENMEELEKDFDGKDHENGDMNDSGNWGKIEQKMRDFLVEKGPPARPPPDFRFPRDGIDRCFTYSSYVRRMSKGESQDRKWLVYSKAKDKVFCFCCKLFCQEGNPTLLASTGYNDWRNASFRLKKHETTHQHIVSKIQEALDHLAEYSDNPGHRSEAGYLAGDTHRIIGFDFLLGMVIWYDLLYAVNIVSKTLQSQDMDLEVAISQLGGLVDYLKNYRETGFGKAKVEATQIAIEMGIKPIFPTKSKRLIKRKRQDGEDVENVDEIQMAEEESFRIDYFLNIIDQVIMSIEVRFEQFQTYEKIFGFLFGIKKLRSAKDDELMASCIKFEAALTHGEHSDIDGKDLFMELKLLRGVLLEKITKAVKVLNFLKKMDGCYPNTWIAYRLLLTVPISVAFAERTFSKLKLIKNYLHSTMSQDRLNELSMISIEQAMVEKLDYPKLLNDFAAKKARRVIFHG